MTSPATHPATVPTEEERECPHGDLCCQSEPCSGPSDPETQNKRVELLCIWFVETMANARAWGNEPLPQIGESDADDLLERLDELTFGAHQREAREYMVWLANGIDPIATARTSARSAALEEMTALHEFGLKAKAFLLEHGEAAADLCSIARHNQKASGLRVLLEYARGLTEAKGGK